MNAIIEWITTLDNYVVREWVNGLWFAVSCAMCFEFGHRFISQVRIHGRRWRRDLGTRAILALFGYFVGETLMRGWIWLLLAMRNAGNPYVVVIEDGYYVAFVAAFLAVWGALCCLYIFSNNHWAWMRALVVIMVLLAFEAALV